MTLFETRKEFGLSQLKAANICDVPRRTYIRYENNNSYGNILKRNAMIKAIVEACEITEDKGILSTNQIIEGVRSVINEKYQNDINLCYLFGSYAKGYAKSESDVDLCVSTELKGLDFVGLAEDLHIALHKKVDLIRLDNASAELIYEIMKDGIKIYG